MTRTTVRTTARTTVRTTVRAALAAAMLAAAAGPAAALATYAYDLALPCEFDCAPGEISVSATITVDAFGQLSQANLLDFEFVFESPSYAGATVLTPANALNNFGAFATPHALTFTLLPATEPGPTPVFFVVDGPGLPTGADVEFSLFGGFGDPPEIVLRRRPVADPGAPVDSGSLLLNPAGDTVVFQRVAAEKAVIPLPGALPLSAAGALALALLRRRRRG